MCLKGGREGEGERGGKMGGGVASRSLACMREIIFHYLFDFSLLFSCLFFFNNI